MNDNEMVACFLRHMRLEPRKVAGWPSEDELNFRVNALAEECNEVLEASLARDLAGVADGLVDLTYFAHGFALRCGIPWGECFREVHEKNMLKVRGPTSRGWALDAQKPPGWSAPNLTRFLGVGPWPTHSEL